MEININDYISEDQKREIAEDMFRQAFAQKLRDSNDVSRILSNISYKVVFQEIDAAVEGGGETLQEQIRDRAFEHINKGGNYGIFRSKDHWNDASAATKIVGGVRTREARPH